MGCLPDSGNCERHHTDAFIIILNEIDNREYRHVACLDQIYRNTPQPEALYKDQRTREDLVVERKTVFWPEDYILRHKNDHHLMELIASSTSDIFTDATYELTLPYLIAMSQKELEIFSSNIVNGIRKNLSNVENMELINKIECGYKWLFRKLHPCDSEDFGLAKGLVVNWKVDAIDPDIGDSSYAIPKLRPQLTKIYLSCHTKFANYRNARRVLLLDQQGDLGYMNTKWWLNIFSELEPSSSISEIWSGLYVTVTEEGEWGWIFRKLYPSPGSPTKEIEGVLLDEFVRR